MSCPDHEPNTPRQNGDHCAHKTRRPDYLLWGSAATIVILYTCRLLLPDGSSWFNSAAASVFELINLMWWSMLLAIVFVGVLARVPQELIIKTLGEPGTWPGLFRAAFAGVALDLCSHGILMVGVQLYQRGVSLGQVMAFLIASPWNSISLTVILIALIGLPWALLIILLSMVIAIVSGRIFDTLVSTGVLPDNRPAASDVPVDSSSWGAIRAELAKIRFSFENLIQVVKDGLKGSKMVMRWLLFGIVLAAAIRSFIDLETYQTLFGPTLAGLGLTLIAATVIEVCSEGSAPIAADLLKRGGAPGNSFTFLMAGVSTDYTEIMSLKDASNSWKIALFLPLVTLPQILTLGWLLNQYHI